MTSSNMLNYIKGVLDNLPEDWLNLTTHRLDIYNEDLAKVQFLEEFEALVNMNNTSSLALKGLPTAYDYIRLGHPLSCILEWLLGKLHNIDADNVISFSSRITPLLSILRKNLLESKSTRIVFTDDLSDVFESEILRTVYGYKYEFCKIENISDVSQFDGSTVFITKANSFKVINLDVNVDFYLNLYEGLGSVLIVNGHRNSSYISEVQHVRRRETIAMTPANCQLALHALIEGSVIKSKANRIEEAKSKVIKSISEITNTITPAIVGSSGLSVQYAIMMGLVHNAIENHKGKAIKFIVPPNCYGGTNDQARRVAACIDNVEVVDLPVDAGNDMVKSIDTVLNEMAHIDAVPYIIAEIPTNPRVEVPDLLKLREVLSVKRKTANDEIATDPVFILDQTFCPNVHFLGDGDILSTVRAISYASGSKFPSGGKCTAGYCIANYAAEALMKKIKMHLTLCDNEATGLQYEILADQLPSMNKRIKGAYDNTREFVNYIMDTLPEAKINFVTEELAEQGFTPSVFSLDLPTIGDSDEEREAYKRELNHRLISMMINEIPDESKYCVSYGQLKGCYWTIPATSTQGTTKESDKDYIARVALSTQMDLELHKKVFLDFVRSI